MSNKEDYAEKLYSGQSVIGNANATGTETKIVACIFVRDLHSNLTHFHRINIAKQGQ